MDGEELPGLPTAAAELGQNLEGLPVDDVDVTVGAVGQVEEALVRIPGEVDVPDGSVPEGLGSVLVLLDEGAVSLEDLDPVVGTVTHVHQPVLGGLGAVHRVPELLRKGGVGIVGTEVLVGRLVSVGAPVAEELTGLGVQDRHPLVPIAVGHVCLFPGVVHHDLGHHGEVLGGVAVRPLPGLADLLDELPVPGELEDVGVTATVSADPDVVVRIQGQPVIGGGPGVRSALLGSAPAVDQVPFRVELEDRRSGQAARRVVGRIGLRPLVQASLTMDDVDVVPGIDSDPDGGPHDPVVGQRLGPEGIHLEEGHLHHVRLGRLGAVLERFLSAGESHDQSDHDSCGDQLRLHP